MDVKQPIKFYRVEDTILPQQEQEQLLLKMGETAAVKKSSLEDLSEMLQEQTEFKACLEEDFLLQFLRTAKFDASKAFNRIKKFYSTQKNFPRYYEFCAQEALKKAPLNDILISPYRLKDNSLLIINKYCKRDLAELPVKEKYYLDLLNIYELLKNPLNQMCGYSYIIDLEGLTLSRVFQYNVQYMRVAMDMLQGAFPFRTKALYFVNTPSIYKMVYNICAPLISTKLKQRFHFFSDKSDFKHLHELVPPELLLKEYGGYLNVSDCIDPMKNIHEKEKYFRQHSPHFYTKDGKLKESDQF